MNIKSKKDSLTGFETYIIHNPETNQVIRWELRNNGDLVWKYISPESTAGQYEVFQVTKDDHELHGVVDRLYNEIKNGQIYINDTSINIDFRKANRGSNAKFAASEMYDPKSNMIKWYSDNPSVITSVFINQVNENYQLIFAATDSKKFIDVEFKQIDSFYECGSVPFLRAHQRLGKIITPTVDKIEPKIYTFKKSA